jgi:hypothetical protein
MLVDKEIVDFFASENLGPFIVNGRPDPNQRLNDKLVFLHGYLDGEVVNPMYRIATQAELGHLFSLYVRNNMSPENRSASPSFRTSLRDLLLKKISDDVGRCIRHHPEHREEIRKLGELCRQAIDDPTLQFDDPILFGTGRPNTTNSCEIFNPNNFDLRSLILMPRYAGRSISDLNSLNVEVARVFSSYPEFGPIDPQNAVNQIAEHDLRVTKDAIEYMHAQVRRQYAQEGRYRRR